MRKVLGEGSLGRVVLAESSFQACHQWLRSCPEICEEKALPQATASTPGSDPNEDPRALSRVRLHEVVEKEDDLIQVVNYRWCWNLADYLAI